MKTVLTSFQVIFYKLLRCQDDFYPHICLPSAVLMCLLFTKCHPSYLSSWAFHISIFSFSVSVLSSHSQYAKHSFPHFLELNAISKLQHMCWKVAFFGGLLCAYFQRLISDKCELKKYIICTHFNINKAVIWNTKIFLENMTEKAALGRTKNSRNVIKVQKIKGYVLGYKSISKLWISHSIVQSI